MGQCSFEQTIPCRGLCFWLLPCGKVTLGHLSGLGMAFLVFPGCGLRPIRVVAGNHRRLSREVSLCRLALDPTECHHQFSSSLSAEQCSRSSSLPRISSGQSTLTAARRMVRIVAGYLAGCLAGCHATVLPSICRCAPDPSPSILTNKGKERGLCNTHAVSLRFVPAINRPRASEGKVCMFYKRYRLPTWCPLGACLPILSIVCPHLQLHLTDRTYRDEPDEGQVVAKRHRTLVCSLVTR